MKINIDRETLLAALQAVANVVERRQTLPILGNVLINAEKDNVSFTATDMEVEVSAKVTATIPKAGSLTVPARKLLDICRSLPAEAKVSIEETDKRLKVQTGKSRFVLATLPANEFPSVSFSGSQKSLEIDSADLIAIISGTQFAMAHQDVRYYLNGLLLEAGGRSIKAVATDGHRLAFSERPSNSELPETLQVIVPRKGIAEIQRIAGHQKGPMMIELGANALRITTDSQALTVKLIEGKFPDYERVIPKNCSRTATASKESLKSALQRTSILSNEKFRGVRLSFKDNALKATAHNPEQEEAEEEIEINYSGDELEIGFNVSYLLDVLNVIDAPEVQINFSDANSSCVITNPADTSASYVVMPMRL